MGQILPGVPVWSMTNDSRWPGLPIVVFPGNVGGKEALAEAMTKVRDVLIIGCCVFPPHFGCLTSVSCFLLGLILGLSYACLRLPSVSFVRTLSVAYLQFSRLHCLCCVAAHTSTYFWMSCLALSVVFRLKSVEFFSDTLQHPGMQQQSTT